MTRNLSLAEFWNLAEHVTGINAATLIMASRVELADSALHAPQAGFGGTDFYPDMYDKAAVLACRIAFDRLDLGQLGRSEQRVPPALERVRYPAGGAVRLQVGTDHRR